MCATYASLCHRHKTGHVPRRKSLERGDSSRRTSDVISKLTTYLPEHPANSQEQELCSHIASVFPPILLFRVFTHGHEKHEEWNQQSENLPKLALFFSFFPSFFFYYVY